MTLGLAFVITLLPLLVVGLLAKNFCSKKKKSITGSLRILLSRYPCLSRFVARVQEECSHRSSLCPCDFLECQYGALDGHCRPMPSQVGAHAAG